MKATSCSFVSVFIFPPNKIVSKTYSQRLLRTSESSNLKLVIKNVTGRIRNRKYMIFGLFGQLSSIWNAVTKHQDELLQIRKKKSNCYLRSLYKDFKNVYTRSTLFIRNIHSYTVYRQPLLRKLKKDHEVIHILKSRDKLTSKPGYDAGLDSFSLSRHFHVLQVP